MYRLCAKFLHREQLYAKGGAHLQSCNCQHLEPGCVDPKPNQYTKPNTGFHDVCMDRCTPIWEHQEFPVAWGISVPAAGRCRDQQPQDGIMLYVQTACNPRGACATRFARKKTCCAAFHGNLLCMCHTSQASTQFPHSPCMQDPCSRHAMTLSAMTLSSLRGPAHPHDQLDALGASRLL